MGITTSNFDIICLWIDDYDTKTASRKGRNFVTKYATYCITHTLTSYKDYITAIKKSHPISKENSALEDEFIRIWEAILSYNAVVAKHNADISHRGDIRRSFFAKYTASSPQMIRESIISGRRLLVQEARNKESAAERSLAAAREARIVAERGIRR